jgi:hypothetical protein
MGAETPRSVWLDPREGDRVFFTQPELGDRCCAAVDRVTDTQVYYTRWKRAGRKGWRMVIGADTKRVSRKWWRKQAQRAAAADLRVRQFPAKEPASA